jgi:hypothetical protein
MTTSLRNSKEVKMMRDLDEKEQLNVEIMSQATRIVKLRKVNINL